MKATRQGDSILITPENPTDSKACIYLAKRTPWQWSSYARAWNIPEWAFSGLPPQFSNLPVLGRGVVLASDINPFLLAHLPEHLKPYIYQRPEILNLTSGPWGLWADCGTGKTLITLAAYHILKALGLVDGMIVIGPENGRHVWAGAHSEAARWIDSPGDYVENNDFHEDLLPNEGIIYTTAAKVFLAPYHTWLSERLRTGRFILCIDEVQLCVGPLSKRFATLISWARYCKYRWLLSATPTGNYPDSFWGVYLLLTLSNVTLDAWTEWFKIGQKSGSASQWNKPRLKALGEYLSYCTSVVKKDVVAPHLPPVTEQVIRVPLIGRQRKLYQALMDQKTEKGAVGSQIEAGRKDWKRQLVYLSSMASHPLVSGDSEWAARDIGKIAVLKELISSAGDQKICIWSWHPGVLEWLAKEIGPGCVQYHGEVTKKNKEDAVHRFNNDPTCKYFLGNPSAAGTSLNLGAGTVRIFWDLAWSWVQYHQACERINRITRTQPITSYVMIAENTVEELMYRSIQRKEELASLITSERTPVEEKEVKELWKS